MLTKTLPQFVIGMQFDDFAEAQNSRVALGMFIMVDHDLDLMVRNMVEVMVKMTEMMIEKLVEKMAKLIEMLAFDNHISIRVLHIFDQEPKDPRSLGFPVQCTSDLTQWWP